jgi:hypothetical protein
MSSRWAATVRRTSATSANGVSTNSFSSAGDNGQDHQVATWSPRIRLAPPRESYNHSQDLGRTYFDKVARSKRSLEAVGWRSTAATTCTRTTPATGRWKTPSVGNRSSLATTSAPIVISRLAPSSSNCRHAARDNRRGLFDVQQPATALDKPAQPQDGGGSEWHMGWADVASHCGGGAINSEGPCNDHFICPMS